MPSTKTRPGPKGRKNAESVRSPAPTRSERKAGAKSPRTINGIPLKRKVIWVFDTDSPEFADAIKRGHEAMKVPGADRDGMQFIEALTADPEWQKWWAK
jgi:hypothetical protein